MTDLRQLVIGLSLCVMMPTELALANAPNLRDANNIQLGNAIYIFANNDPFQAMAALEQANAQNQLGKDGDLARLFLANTYIEQGLTTKAMTLYRDIGEHGSQTELRDAAWLNLAKLAFENQQLSVANEAANNIDDSLTKEQETELTLIRAHLLLTERKPEQAIAAVPENLTFRCAGRWSPWSSRRPSR